MRLIIDSYNLAAAERLLVVEALATAGSIVEAAQLLDVNRHKLRRLILKHRIEWPRAAGAQERRQEVHDHLQNALTDLDKRLELAGAAPGGPNE